MIEINGICYADNFAPVIKVVKATPMPSYVLHLKFSTGEEKDFDVSPLLEYPVFRPLKAVEVFNAVQLDGETVTWLDGEIDIAPETLYGSDSSRQ